MQHLIANPLARHPHASNRGLFARLGQIASVLGLLALVAAGGSLGACSTDDGDGGPDEPARLIPPGDSDFAALEMPEAAGECEGALDCEASCEHSCAPLPDGPFTCPIVPIPVPDRVEDADCACVESVCVWRDQR